jgi:antitoxin (DNA-binding transcriptional repressor) of toxin-antitoxin stability system
VAQPVRKSGVKEVPLSEVKDDLSRFLREAGEREIVITRHGKPSTKARRVCAALLTVAQASDWVKSHA